MDQLNLECLLKMVSIFLMNHKYLIIYAIIFYILFLFLFLFLFFINFYNYIILYFYVLNKAIKFNKILNIMSKNIFVDIDNTICFTNAWIMKIQT